MSEASEPHCSGRRVARFQDIAAGTAASTERESAVQRLSWRSFAVRKNVSNRRRKLLNAGTGHYDAVAAAVSFLGDAQESPTVVLSELDVEMLALNLQFFRLDDVIHFALKPPSLDSPAAKWKKNPQFFNNFLPTERRLFCPVQRFVTNRSSIAVLTLDNRARCGRRPSSWRRSDPRGWCGSRCWCECGRWG